MQQGGTQYDGEIVERLREFFPALDTMLRIGTYT
jgi:hypothetical protein